MGTNKPSRASPCTGCEIPREPLSQRGWRRWPLRAHSPVQTAGGCRRVPRHRPEHPGLCTRGEAPANGSLAFSQIGQSQSGTQQGPACFSQRSRPLRGSAPAWLLINSLPPLRAPATSPPLPPPPVLQARGPFTIAVVSTPCPLNLHFLIPDQNQDRNLPEEAPETRGRRDCRARGFLTHAVALRPSSPSSKMGMLAQETLQAQNATGEGGGHVGPGLSKEGQVWSLGCGSGEGWGQPLPASEHPRLGERSR